ncbi:MAG TPA: hypothetical protein VGO11_12110 [Chthoniobacteraceae bacterium]|jgi:hypothetical protein|nr:hypothetical protein [Chthoniobacteraceae bacterium]
MLRELWGLASILHESNPAYDADEYWWKLDEPDLLTALNPA